MNLASVARSLVALGVLVPLFGSPPLRAANDPFEINVVISLSGPGAFLGRGAQQGYQALEQHVNASGGIRGRPVKFVIHDDQTNPQVDVQLANAIQAKGVSVMLGPNLAATCKAVLPLLREGPVSYCSSPAVELPAGSYMFSGGVANFDLAIAYVRYFRERGATRLAIIASTDASGQDFDRGLDAALALPENKSVTLVGREHFSASDISAGAQIARIKAANPQVLIAGTTGAPLGTVFHGISDGGLDIPVVTGYGNATYAAMRQFAQILPKELFFGGVACMTPNEITDRAAKRAVDAYLNAVRATGIKPDVIEATAWDMGSIVVDALQKLGVNATARQLRDYIANLRGWRGAYGVYDFRAVPQRGLSETDAILARWDPDKDSWTGMSSPGGMPLPAQPKFAP